MAHKEKRLRQAVVIVHGMGEQRPLETLNSFIDAAIPGITEIKSEDEVPVYYSRPVDESDSYEARKYIARATDNYPQTEFYEYHWSHKMQGNKFSDLWETFRNILFSLPWSVPVGLRFVWAFCWAVIIGVGVLVARGQVSFSDLTSKDFYLTLLGGGFAAAVVTWILTVYFTGKVTSSFVDVVRYLDTSPRSYAVRKDIRRGMIEFLESLHTQNRYERIIIVAHSLGAYVAYDGINYLWTRMNQAHIDLLPEGVVDDRQKLVDADAIEALETEAQKLRENPDGDPTRYQELQRKLWAAYRDAGNPWLITDFVTVGTPMYMADRLMTKDRDAFFDRMARKEITACPPSPDSRGFGRQTLYSYKYSGNEKDSDDGKERRKEGDVLYHGAPFAVVRWSNMWFPAHYWFFGDWFGGPLRPLFGPGVNDHALSGNDLRRFLPAWPHVKYFAYPNDESADSATTVLHEFMELNAGDWFTERLEKTTTAKFED